MKWDYVYQLTNQVENKNVANELLFEDPSDKDNLTQIFENFNTRKTFKIQILNLF